MFERLERTFEEYEEKIKRASRIFVPVRASVEKTDIIVVI